jgi:uncharacterized membrane protein
LTWRLVAAQFVDHGLVYHELVDHGLGALSALGVFSALGTRALPFFFFVSGMI